MGNRVHSLRNFALSVAAIFCKSYLKSIKLLLDFIAVRVLNIKLCEYNNSFSGSIVSCKGLTFTYILLVLFFDNTGTFCKFIQTDLHGIKQKRWHLDSGFNRLSGK